MLSVAVEDVAPDGTVKRLTGGWQVISHRALTTTKSRYLEGKLIQGTFHPFTSAAEKPLAAGAVAPIDFKVFPTVASIEPGHRLRIAVKAFDVPHLSPTVPELPGSLTAITLHDSAKYPSVLTTPKVKPARQLTTSSRRPRASSP